MNTYLIDTYAWVEYFKGTNAGKSVDKLISSGSKLITLESNLSELKCVALRDSINFSDILKIVKVNSFILPITEDIWLEASSIRHEFRKKISNFGLMDAILVAKQRELKCKIISGDQHFKNLKKVLYIGK